MLRAALIAIGLLACNAEEREDKERECDALAEEIRATARERGRTEGAGVCNDPALPDLGAKCERLAACNEELENL